MTFEAAQQLILMLFGGGGVGALGYLLRFRAERRRLGADTGKIEADAVSVLTGTAVSLVVPLQAQIERLNQHVELLESQVAETKRELRRTTLELRDTAEKLETARAIIAHHGLTLDNTSLNPPEQL